MKAQQVYFDSTIQHQVNNFASSPETESKSETASFKLTASQKIALKTIAKKQNIKVSALVSASIELYLSLMPHTDTLQENIDVIAPMLKRLR